MNKIVVCEMDTTFASRLFRNHPNLRTELFGLLNTMPSQLKLCSWEYVQLWPAQHTGSQRHAYDCAVNTSNFTHGFKEASELVYFFFARKWNCLQSVCKNFSP